MTSFDLHAGETVADFHLLGTVPFDACIALQRRLRYQVSSEVNRRLVVLLCEHPEIISIGRSGSRSHIRLTTAELRRRQLAVRWINRSGGCILHAPGQLCVYPIVPLDRLQWTASEYRQRLRAGITAALSAMGIA